MRVELADDFVHYTSNHGPAQIKMNLTYTEKGNIVEVELKFVDDDSDFLVKWKGPIKDSWY